MYAPLLLVVCGGRAYDNREHVYSVLSNIAPDIIAHGACGCDADDPKKRNVKLITGADRLADDWARSFARPPVWILRFPARWGALGRGAGPVRNKKMLDALMERWDGHIQVVCFPGGAGTANCCESARARGIDVIPCCKEHPYPF